MNKEEYSGKNKGKQSINRLYSGEKKRLQLQPLFLFYEISMYEEACTTCLSF